MQIQTFILKMIINERKILTHYDIINSIEEKIVSVITQCTKNQNCGIIPTYGGQISLLLIH